MKKYLKKGLKSIGQILIIATITIFIDCIIAGVSNDDSIWLGESIGVVASVVLGPIVGGLSTLISCIVTDYLTYHSFDFVVVGIFESISIILIGMIYRKLMENQKDFGIKNIVVFNFVQILVNVTVLYLATPPATVLFFGSIISDWTKEKFIHEMAALGDNALSACFSIALIGTPLLAFCNSIKKRLENHDNFFSALRSLLKPIFISKEYRPRALEYSVGIVFSIALTMIDGVVSGHILGSNALAAVSIMFPLVSLCTFISNLITSGCSNLCARIKGNGNFEKARKLFSLGFFTVIALGLTETILFYFIKDFYFNYFTTTKEIEALARTYYHFYIFVPPFMAMTTFLDEMVSSDGDDMLSYAGYLVSFGVNVGLSIVLSKTIGIGGLSLATMISYICYLIVVSIHFLKKNNTYKIRFYFSLKSLLDFMLLSVKSNISGLCMFMASTAFTKSILLFLGSDYLIANTVLCAMLEVYEMVNGPSEAAEYLIATYEGEKNSEGIKILFKEALVFCLLGGIAVSLILLLLPNIVLILYGIEKTPFSSELIECIRFCSIGTIAASIGGFLSDYYGDIGKSTWSCLVIISRAALFPMLFCVTFCLNGGIVAMGKGLLLSQIFAIAIFYGFVFIVKGGESIPYMLDAPDFKKVKMNSFRFISNDYENIISWISDNLKNNDVNENKISEVKKIIHLLFKETEKKNKKNIVYGECVFRFIDNIEIIIKDNGELFKPNISDENYSYNVLMSCNRSMICLP